GVLITRLFCAREYPGYTWVSERELSEENNRTRQHLADGALKRGKVLIPIEYERTSKNLYRVKKAMREHDRNGGRAYYYAEEGKVRRALEGVRSQNGFKGI